MYFFAINGKNTEFGGVFMQSSDANTAKKIVVKNFSINLENHYICRL